MKQQLEQIQMETAVAQLQNVKADTALKLANAGYKGAQEALTKIDADLRDENATLEALRIRNDMQETANQDRQLDIQQENVNLNKARLIMEANKTQ